MELNVNTDFSYFLVSLFLIFLMRILVELLEDSRPILHSTIFHLICFHWYYKCLMDLYESNVHFLFSILLQNLDSCLLFLGEGSIESCFIHWNRTECGLALPFTVVVFHVQTVGAEASRIGINGPWITKSYLELILERKGWNWGLFFIFISLHLYISLLLYFF